MLHDARAIANALLSFGDRTDLPISPLKLQKLIYFTHGHSWRTRGTGLVFNRFQAWDHGPVVKVVYDAFKDLGFRPIRRRATWTNFAAGGIEPATATLLDEEMECIQQSMTIYGPVNADILSRLSHAAGGPWDTVRKNSAQFPDGIIPQQLIEDYFINKFKELHSQ
ncbi:MAG: DUF4065 domain-containing protein [Reyranella sp.]|nr:DUF4065 domain-containing protein [Reyranella sp.]